MRTADVKWGWIVSKPRLDDLCEVPVVMTWIPNVLMMIYRLFGLIKSIFHHEQPDDQLLLCRQGLQKSFHISFL